MYLSPLAVLHSWLGFCIQVTVQIRPGEPSNIHFFIAFEVYHPPQSVRVNDFAPENMNNMLVTLDTSHLEMSPLNDDANRNMDPIVVTLDTSHFEMSPEKAFAPENMASV